MFTIETLFAVKQLLLAIGLGFILGVERELAHKSAGVRTHTLVALGSALFSMMSVILGTPYGNPTQIASQVVVGVGFLGAGLIVVHNSKVQGLTTAAGVWVAAAIGMAVGLGLNNLALISTLLTVIIFVILWPIEHRFIEKIARINKEELD